MKFLTKKKIKKIVFYAYRNNAGPIGGPGGMLYVQKSLIGEDLKNIPIRYRFMSKKKIYRKIKNLLLGGIMQAIVEQLFNANSYYVVNDIGTACGLSLLHRRYSLIFHQQGPLIEERLNFGEHFTKFQQKFIHWVEKRAFEKAESVHFPSKGAEDYYFQSAYRSSEKVNIKIGKVLYNTLSLVDSSKFISNIKKENDTLTFISVGSLTKAKGQDLSLKFIEKFLQKYKKKCRYILVGKGVLEKELIEKAKILESEHTNFEFIHLSKISHNEVLALNRIADIYIMLHRISIFDLATLEAMVNDNAIILSNVYGNKDFNKDENIILVDTNNMEKGIDELLNENIECLKEKNHNIFNKYFSNQVFIKNYTELLEEKI